MYAVCNKHVQYCSLPEADAQVYRIFLNFVFVVYVTYLALGITGKV